MVWNRPLKSEVFYVNQLQIFKYSSQHICIDIWGVYIYIYIHIKRQRSKERKKERRWQFLTHLPKCKTDSLLLSLLLFSAAPLRYCFPVFLFFFFFLTQLPFFLTSSISRLYIFLFFLTNLTPCRLFSFFSYIFSFHRFFFILFTLTLSILISLSSFFSLFYSSLVFLLRCKNKQKKERWLAKCYCTAARFRRLLSYEAHTISFKTFFVRAFKNEVHSWRFSMLLLYILDLRWLTKFYDFSFKWTATAAIGIHLTKAWLSQLVSFKNAIWHFRRTRCNKILFWTWKKCHRNVWNASDCFWSILHESSISFWVA